MPSPSGCGSTPPWQPSDVPASPPETSPRTSSDTFSVLCDRVAISSGTPGGQQVLGCGAPCRVSSVSAHADDVVLLRGMGSLGSWAPSGDPRADAGADRRRPAAGGRAGRAAAGGGGEPVAAGAAGQRGAGGEHLDDLRPDREGVDGVPGRPGGR